MRQHCVGVKKVHETNFAPLIFIFYIRIQFLNTAKHKHYHSQQVYHFVFINYINIEKCTNHFCFVYFIYFQLFSHVKEGHVCKNRVFGWRDDRRWGKRIRFVW